MTALKMTKVMATHALGHEDPRLQLRINQFIDRVELALKQALPHAALTGKLPQVDILLWESLLMALATVCQNFVSARLAGIFPAADCMFTILGWDD